jgi:hypothetical protein
VAPDRRAEHSLTALSLSIDVSVTRVTTTKEARDSAGRTTRQTSLYVPSGAPASLNTVVVDPGSHTMTQWMSQSKQATVFHRPEPKSLPANLPITTSAGAGGSGSSMPADGHSRSATAAVARIRDRQREQIGGKTIAGVYAERTRITMTIPEGAEGNDRPMTNVNSTWRSPDLDINLLTVNEDPRSGTRTNEVTDLDRAEPDPSVFQVRRLHTQGSESGSTAIEELPVRRHPLPQSQETAQESLRAFFAHTPQTMRLALREKTPGVACADDGCCGLFSASWRTNPRGQDRGYPATRRPHIWPAGGGTQPEIHDAGGHFATSTGDIPGQTADRCFSRGDWEPLWR